MPYVPEGQGEHAAAPPVENVPGEHVVGSALVAYAKSALVASGVAAAGAFAAIVSVKVYRGVVDEHGPGELTAE